MSPAPDARTQRGRVGRAAEDVAARTVHRLGWRILARNVVVGQDEIDLVCIDGQELVLVEVRGHSTGRFGAAEESVDRRKLGRNFRAGMALVRSGWLAKHGLSGRMPWRIDVIAVELWPTLARDTGGPTVRHIRRVTLD